jgi:hypothetical protein
MKTGCFTLAGLPGNAVALDDHARLPWRFLARHIAIDGLSGAL